MSRVPDLRPSPGAPARHHPSGALGLASTAGDLPALASDGDRADFAEDPDRLQARIVELGEAILDGPKGRPLGVDDATRCDRQNQGEPGPAHDDDSEPQRQAEQSIEDEHGNEHERVSATGSGLIRAPADARAVAKE